MSEPPPPPPPPPPPFRQEFRGKCLRNRSPLEPMVRFAPGPAQPPGSIDEGYEMCYSCMATMNSVYYVI
jgi:hypothetical protein